MTKVWKLDFQAMGLSHAHKFVLLAWADHADDDGVVHASIDRIAWKSEYSERQIRRLRTEMINQGILCVLAESKGPGFATVYRIRPVMGTPLPEWRPRYPAKPERVQQPNEPSESKADAVSGIQNGGSERPAAQGSTAPSAEDRTGCPPSPKSVDNSGERRTLKHAKADMDVRRKADIDVRPTINTSSLNGARRRESEPQAALPAPRPTTPEEREIWLLNNSARNLGIDEHRPGESVEAFNRRVGEAQLRQFRRVQEAAKASHDAEVSA